jgi:hypothetical protein
MDYDRDGCVSEAEFDPGADTYWGGSPPLGRSFECDFAGDGCLSDKEFGVCLEAFWSSMPKWPPTFQQFIDSDGNGCISQAESGYTPGGTKFAAISGGDGCLSADEYETWILSLPAWPLSGWPTFDQFVDSDGDSCISEAESGAPPSSEFSRISGGDRCLSAEEFNAAVADCTTASLNGVDVYGPCASELFTSSEGTFGDGSQCKKYKSNADCRWVIAPPASDSNLTVLKFDAFEVEKNYDYVTINSCESLGNTTAFGVPECVGQRQIARLSGDLDSLSGRYFSAMSIMEVVFSSDNHVNFQA